MGRGYSDFLLSDSAGIMIRLILGMLTWMHGERNCCLWARAWFLESIFSRRLLCNKHKTLSMHCVPI